MAEPHSDWHDIPVALPPVGGSTRFHLGELALLLCNASGQPYVVEDRCPHTYISMEGGMIIGTVLQCPLHGGQLDLTDGSPANPPIRRPVRTFGVRALDGRLQVNIAATKDRG